MFLLGWMIDGVLTVIGCILLACAFGNLPITFLFFFVFPIAFILIWCTGSYPSCIDRLADVAWRVSMVRTTYGGSSVVNDYPCPKMPFADFSEE